MRVSPIGIAFRNASVDEIYRAAEEAVRSSHVHVEAVDAAGLQACCVAACARHRESCGTEFDALRMLSDLIASARTPVLRRRLQRVLEELRAATPQTSDIKTLRKILRERPEEECPGSSFDFQIASIDLLPCVMWAICRYSSEPEEAVVRAVSLGGDTDTVAACVGAAVGALHGVGWIPSRWWDVLENGVRGRDFAVLMAERLSELDERVPLTFGGDEEFPVFEEYFIEQDAKRTEM